MARLNVLLTGYEITDYLFERTSSAALALDHDTIRGTADLEIWTGAGGTGTQLALTTDYTVSDEDADLSTEAGVSIYTKLAIVNGTYHNVDLYATYKTIGDYNSTTSVRLVQIGLKEITGNYTVTADDHTIIVNTASAVTITIPDGLPQGFDLCISRTLASTAAVTVAMSGTETVEGAASFVTHGAFASSTLNDAEVTIRKKLTTDWRFVTGSVRGSNAYGDWVQRSDGMLENYMTVAGFAPGVAFTLYPKAYKSGALVRLSGSVVPSGVHAHFEAYPNNTTSCWILSQDVNNGYLVIAVGAWK